MAVISDRAVSFQEILTDLTQYLRSKPEYARWKDLFESAYGQTLLELIAGLGALYSYRIYRSRQESYLSTARLRSSIVSQAETLGYSVRRGEPPHITLTMTPTIDTTVGTLDVVGYYEDKDVVALSAATYTTGTQYTGVELALGYRREITVQVTTSDLTLFRVTAEGISERYLLQLNGTEVPTTNRYAELLEDKWLVITSPWGVDLAYMNTLGGQWAYRAGDQLKLIYVELIPDITNFDPQRLSWTQLTGVDLNSVTYVSRQDPELDSEIKLNTPFYHETQSLVRGRKDFARVVKGLRTDLIDVNQQEPGPLSIDITYVKSDLGLLTSAEKTDLLNALSQYVPMGVPMSGIQVVDPVQQSLTLSVTLDVYASSNTPTGTIDGDIQSVLSKWERRLGISMDTDAVQKDLYLLDYVKKATVTVASGVSSLQWNEYWPTVSYTKTVNYV